MTDQPLAAALDDKVQRVNITQGHYFIIHLTTAVFSQQLLSAINNHEKIDKHSFHADALSTKVKQPLQAQSELTIPSFIGLCILLVQWNKHKHWRATHFRVVMLFFFGFFKQWSAFLLSVE